MEKENSIPILTRTAPSAASRLRTFTLACLSAAGLWLFTLTNGFIDEGSCQSSSTTTKEFEWNKLVPTDKLHWVSCYEGFQCARLRVPLNYEDPDAAKAAIALLRYPAKVSRNHNDYKGPILFNPGGPGGSGVGIVLKYGHLFQGVLGDEYDMVGFDPRGIGHTTPVVDVFKNPLERAAWDLRNLDTPFVNETNTALVEVVAKARLLNALVAQEVPVAAEHANTAVVCRDMLTIVQAHGYDKLQYWGFSYGSVLGASFASLFPDNVGRLVIDGVVDATNYYAGLWNNNLRVADKGLEMIFNQCVESGKQDCPLYESTSEKVKDRYLRLLDSLDKKPVTVHNNNAIAIITKRTVRTAFFGVLYRPYRSAKPFFGALRALEDRDGLPLYEMEGIPDNGESGTAVMCTDAGPVEYDLEEFQKHFEGLAKTSYFGDIWSQIRLQCVGWKIKAKNPWSGPIAGNTSFPVLLVGNTEDPVTPDAKKMSHVFKDSVVLTQRSAGHCSIAANSLCTVKAIRAYFRDGALPTKGTVCEVEDHMFRNITAEVAIYSQEDAALMDSWKQISQEIRFNHLPGRH